MVNSLITYLVGGWATPLKNMTSSIAMMTFPILMGKCKKWQPAPPTSYILMADYPLEIFHHIAVSLHCTRSRLFPGRPDHRRGGGRDAGAHHRPPRPRSRGTNQRWKNEDFTRENLEKYQGKWEVHQGKWKFHSSRWIEQCRTDSEFGIKLGNFHGKMKNKTSSWRLRLDSLVCCQHVPKCKDDACNL